MIAATRSFEGTEQLRVTSPRYRRVIVGGGTEVARAIAAQAVPAVDMNWS
jgi:hypothetical protein